MEIANEQDANQRYMAILQRKAAMKIQISVARSSLWTGTGRPIHSGPTVGAVVARIALREPDPEIGGTTFYIGPWHVDDDGIVAFSWAAPIATALYDGNDDTGDFGEVTVRRTMLNAGDQIYDFTDDWACDPLPESPFQPTHRLSIPKPPTPAAPRPEDRPRPLPAPTPTSEPQPADEPSGASVNPPPAAPAAKPKAKPRAERPLRAAEAVRAALAAPRGASLPTLLGTLQPDQYAYVTRPLEPPLVVQGHPGTGKTVIAAHRAAWLVHPERGEANATLRVLIVGPNDHYAEHLKGVLDSLVAQRSRVVAIGLSRLLVQLRRLDYKLEGALDGVHYDVDNELGYVIDAAALELRSSGDLLRARSTEAAAEILYNAIRDNKAAGTLLTEDRDLATYLKKLPRWKLALTQRRFLPLVTYCSITAVPYEARGFDHVIVDEAQDVRPLEWRIIRTLNRGQSWTILGDMNQRRSDWSYNTWDALGGDLDIANDDGRLTPDVFARGYRSTGPIIKYANHLLPAKERGASLIQTDGPPPRIYRVKEPEVAQSTVAISEHLCRVYSQGTVAVISTSRRLVGDQMVREGWRQDQVDTRVMQYGNYRVHLLTPESARGLEFDAVVVVEPADFPENLARLGSLYTSLTRANRELAVVHARPLPDGLRNQGLASRVSELRED